MKTYINKLSLRGFKSFNRKVELNFGPGLNCVIGANGSGKSNVVDGSCFVLGRLSSKDLRAENYSELLFKRKGTIAAEGEVSFYLDNRAKIFPADSKFIEIRRRIKKKGQTQYKFNGRNATRAQILELLAPARIFPLGHNIILQGDIARFVDMKPIEKRQVIEEVSGISTYEERKTKALSELEKIEGKLRDAQLILTEKETYLKGLEEEKKEAEKHRALKEELLSTQATEIRLRIKNTDVRKKGVLAKIEKCNKSSEKFKADIETSNQKIKELKDQISALEKEIEKKGGEESLVLQKEVENLKVELEKSKTLIASSKNEIGRIQSRRSALEKNLEEIDVKIQEKEKEKEKINKEKEKILKAESALKVEAGISGDAKEFESGINKLEQELGQLRQRKEELLVNIQKNISETKICEYELTSTSERIADINKEEQKLRELKDYKTKYKKIIEELNQFANKDSKLALQIGAVKKELIKKEEELAKIKLHASSTQELLLRNRAVKEILEAKKKKQISGILGTVAELGRVDPQYSAALKVAAGGRLTNIVVERSDVAIKCLQFLKGAKAGIATFLPLDKLRTPDDRALKKLRSKPGVIGLASELVSTDSKFKDLFKYIFRNTIIVKDVDTAKKLGISKYRIVTLDGDLFEITGAITGGYRRASIGIGFEQKGLGNSMTALSSEILKFKKEVKDIEKSRADLDIKIMNLRKAKAELEGKAEFAKGISDKINLKDNLEKKLKDIKDKKQKLEKEIKKLEKSSKDLEDKISKKIREQNSLKDQLKELQFGEKRTKMNSLLEKKTQLESQLSIISATLENSLLPDKENISKVLKELGKERKTFDKQILQENAKIKKFEKELKVKEGEEKSFFGKLKSLFANKNKLSEELQTKQTEFNNLQLELSKAEQEKNTLSIERAQHDAELARLQEEMQPYAKVKSIEIKGVEEAKRKIRYLNSRIAELGNVNLKALELYETMKEEYDKLAWKVSKLSVEKKDILDVIEEIDKKKKEVFLKTYNEIAKNFDKIHTKISDKNKANLVLENKDSPFEGGVLVRITDKKGKRMSLAALSGGEKVIIALAFIFAIQEHEPAPFYLLDEIDAALDKVNSEKVAKLLKEYSKKSQIIIISHNDAVISEADTLYGVSMNKEGESNIVSLKI